HGARIAENQGDRPGSVSGWPRSQPGGPVFGVAPAPLCAVRRGGDGTVALGLMWRMGPRGLTETGRKGLLWSYRTYIRVESIAGSVLKARRRRQVVGGMGSAGDARAVQLAELRRRMAAVPARGAEVAAPPPVADEPVRERLPVPSALAGLLP